MPLLSTYLMAFCALTFAAISAMTIVYVLGHIDEPARPAASPAAAPESKTEHIAA